ncbi:hypothetical protein [Nevskia sp.]|uniref:hypothetical protein n=1 Tax=Nevskia sp. TaxID=1929292 RepID=UPI0025F6D442|nr:hypothetical protein [Nevskia sp.]
MTILNRPGLASERSRTLLLFAAFIALHLASWPVEFSFSYWVSGDRGLFLNLSYLLDRGHRLGVDTYYLYGLLPVLVQDLLFDVFGRSHWPIIGCQIVYLALMAHGFAKILGHTPDPLRWTIGAVCLAPIIIWVNQNFQYLFVHVSMTYALALVLERRLPRALAVTMIGCWSVPSLPLVLAVGLGGLLLLDWWKSDDRRLSALFQRFLPALLTYVAIGLLLAAYFGWASVLATALPFQGVKFYSEAKLGAFTSLKVFLYPGRNEARPEWSALRYYLLDRATWWMLSSALLAWFGARSVRELIGKREIDPRAAFIALCALIHLMFVAIAYGIPKQHVFYDFVLVAGVVAGLSAWTTAPLRKPLIGVFFVVAIASHGHQFANTRWLWKQTQPSPQSHGFWAFPAIADDFAKLVELSKAHHVFMLSYSTGLHHYFPTLHSADSWIINIGQLLPPDKQRLLASMDAAEYVVEDLTRFTTLFEIDADIKGRLKALCLVSKGPNFIIWRRTPDVPGGECTSFARDLPADYHLRGEYSL